MGLGRVELPTSPLSGVRSSQLSYRPGFLFRNSSVLTLQFRTILLKMISRTKLNMLTG